MYHGSLPPTVKLRLTWTHCGVRAGGIGDITIQFGAMRMRKMLLFSRLRVVVGAAGLVCGICLGANAALADEPPASWDDRATASAGVPTTCSEAGLDGSHVDVTGEIDDSKTYIDITAVPDDITLAGVVVKGVQAYNLYLADDLGELPWRKLHAPYSPADEGAGVSAGWFACGVNNPSTTMIPTITTTAEATTTTPAVTTSSAPTVEEPLAATGTNTGWLVAIGIVLLLVGAAFVVRPSPARRR